MSATFLASARRRRARAALVSAALVLGSSLFAAAPAQAAPAQPYGTVVSPTGANERQYPSTDSSVRGTLAYHAQVGLRCKVRAQDVEGNTIWYLLRDRATWVSARYMVNTGTVLYCSEVQYSRLNHSPVAKHAKG